jgi:hypothetical protein
MIVNNPKDKKIPIVTIEKSIPEFNVLAYEKDFE